MPQHAGHFDSSSKPECFVGKSRYACFCGSIRSKQNAYVTAKQVVVQFNITHEALLDGCRFNIVLDES